MSPSDTPLSGPGAAAEPDPELRLKERELELKNRELQHRIETERAAARHNVSPTFTAVVAGLLSVTATVLTALAGGCSTRSLEREKSQRELELRSRDQQFQVILKATEDRTPEDAAKNLLFFVDIGYLPDSAGQIRKLAQAGSVPVLTSAGGTVNNIEEVAAAAPTISDPDPSGYTVRNQITYGPDGRALRVVGTRNVGQMTEPRFIVLHFTGTGTLQGAVDWFRRPEAQNSAHVIVGRDGEVVQMAPFSLATWHVGASQWQGLNGLNRYSVGIDLVNWGRLARRGGRWVAPNDEEVPASEVLEVRDPRTGQVQGWQRFTPRQVEVVANLARALVREYPTISEVLAHSQVSPGRKEDPGPAFPIADVRRVALPAAR
jgi:N-acetylmuramoyl-L-alanine amidase